jgi:hypothetical protein
MLSESYSHFGTGWGKVKILKIKLFSAKNPNVLAPKIKKRVFSPPNFLAVPAIVARQTKKMPFFGAIWPLTGVEFRQRFTKWPDDPRPA